MSGPPCCPKTVAQNTILTITSHLLCKVEEEGHILLLFTYSGYSGCPHKVHTVTCSVHTMGTYYSVIIERLERRA